MKYSESAIRHRVAIVVSTALLLCIGAGMFQAWKINRQYDKARTQADVVRSYVSPENGQPSLGQLPQLTEDLTQLQADLDKLNDQLDVPVIGGIARHTPYLGDRLTASQDLLTLGIELTAISRDASDIANKARVALEKNGFMASSSAIGPTWLEVIQDHQHEIYDLESRIREAEGTRAELD